MKRIGLIILLVALLLTACSSGQTITANQNTTSTSAAATNQPETDQNAVIWPTSDWPTASPAEQAIDAGMLDKLQEKIASEQIDLHSILIIRNGYIVHEKYYSPYTQKMTHTMFSITKSFTSSLIGIAVDQGKIQSVEQKVIPAFFADRTFENPDPRKDAMTLENLLTMSSGLGWVEGNPSYNAMSRSSDWVAWVMNLPAETDPGAEFNYCSGCSHVLSAIVEKSVGESAVDFGDKYLFKPLGITNYRWETDSQNIAIGGWGLNLTPRDMAKLGYLYLHNGAWDGKQIISSNWVKAATTSHILTGNGSDGYGYQFWIYPDQKAYAALGKGGQIIYVIPDKNVIIVATANLPNHGPIFDLIDNDIIPAIK